MSDEPVKQYQMTCRCGAQSGQRANTELTERWFVEHIRAWHKHWLKEVRRALLVGSTRC